MFSKKLLVVIIVFCCFPIFVAKAAPFDVVINEIAWMGTEISYNDEWLELYNNTDNLINLDGWVLKTEDGTPEINLTGAISANSFFLLERTDDTTIPGITADLIYTGALENDGEYLKLYDNSGNLIDEVSCSSSWFAGDNETKQTMERIDPLADANNSSNWQTSQNPGGTPHQYNSGGQTPKEEPTPPESLNPQTQNQNTNPTPNTKNQTPTIITYPSGVIFNEILPSPEGPDETEEWIEIFNMNNFEIDLSGWEIKDGEGGIKTYAFPTSAKIMAKGYLVLTRPVTKIILNNTGDKLTLIQPDGKIIDEVVFEKAPKNQSYSKKDGRWQWTILLTPGKENNIEEIKVTGTTNATKDTGETKEIKILDKKHLLSSLNQSVFNFKNPVSIILVALAISVFAVIIIILFLFFIKKN